MGMLVIEKDFDPVYSLSAASLQPGHVYEDNMTRSLWLGCDIQFSNSRLSAVSVDGQLGAWADTQCRRFRSVNAKLVVEN